MTKSARHENRKNDTISLTKADYEELLERIVDLEDSFALMAAQAEPQVMIPNEVAKKLFNDMSALRAWREYRKRSLREVAGKVGVAPGYLSDIERGRKPGSFAVIVRLARELGIPMELLADQAADAEAVS